jgi:hypothetical protein
LFSSHRRRYLPQWQNYPITDPCFNWDFMTATHIEGYIVCIDQRRAVMIEPCNVPKE